MHSSALFRPLRGVLLSDPLRALFSSLFIGLCAQIALDLPFTPVPITLQTLAVAIVGATLGPIWGALSVCFYLIEGFCGLPVFAHGHAGVHHLFGPTGGYLAGFVASAFIIGSLLKKFKNLPWWGKVLAFACGDLFVFICGISVLYFFVGGWQRALMVGLIPFIPGSLLKIAIATCLTTKR